MVLVMSLVAYGDSSDSESETEDTTTPLPQSSGEKSDVRKMLGLLPPPKGSKPSGKHPVRIALPTVDSSRDSDEEEESINSNQVKRLKMQGGGSKLKALLPQPKGNVKQLGAPRQGVSVSSMVPYTLSKRKQDSLKAEKLRAKRTKSQGKTTAAGGGGGGGSDDSDDEPVTSFFSHLDRSSTTDSETHKTTNASVSLAPVNLPGPSITASSASTSSSSSSSSSSSISSSSASSSSFSSSISSFSTSSSSSSTSSFTPSTTVSYDQTNTVLSHKEAGTEDQYNMAPMYPSSIPNPTTYYSNQDQDLETATSYSWNRFSQPPPLPPLPNPAPYIAQPYIPPQQVQQNTSSPAGDTGDIGGEGEEGGGGGEGGGPLKGTGPGVIIEKEALRRLAGGGHKRRGREDALNNIVDILGDEVMEDVKIYRRHYGEDPSITKLYKVDNSKLKTPTANQKRKHQITWLAHEAKEREFELQKQWAADSQARKDSRSKYGF